MNRSHFLFQLVQTVICFQSTAQQSKVWDDFVKSKKEGKEAILPDFSYAGYKYSEVVIPFVGSRFFDVTLFGAKPNDGLSDKDAIKKAIASASKNGGGIIFFPKGRYIINSASDDQSIIQIQSSNIVFRGASSNENNTVIFFDKDLPPANPKKLWTVPYAIQTSPKEENIVLADVIANAKRESFSIKVSDASNIKKGDWLILHVKNKSKELIKYDLQPISPEPEWKSILEKGVVVNERHQVASVDENLITFVGPIHYDVNKKHGWQISSFAHLENIGFEHLTFEGSWTKEFKHHRSAQDDGDWSILSIGKSVNSWIRNCTFKNVNNAASFSGSAASTAINLTIVGKIGHAAIHASGGSTGILIANVNDIAGMHHAIGVGGGSTT